MNTLKLGKLVQVQHWPASLLILLITTVVYLVSKLILRPAIPRTAPKLLSEGYPVLGALRYFSQRGDFFHQAKTASKTGNFSFFFGKNHIVGMSGVESRKQFFQSSELNMSEGYAVLFTASPSNLLGSEDEKWFARTITSLLKKENFVKNLPIMIGDTKVAFDRMVERLGPEGIMQPFEDIYAIVYQLTMRTVGATEIAESPEMLSHTLKLFETIEQNVSPARIIFPWLPTPNYLRQTIAGGKLYVILDKIIRAREATGKKQDDAVQFLLDSGQDITQILFFVIGSLFAGQINSGVNAAWLTVNLATCPEWYDRVQDEVNSAVQKHRANPDQSPLDILATLSIDDWETEFPAIDLCLRESIRFQLPGTAFRKNISGKDLPIAKTGEVIPKDSFAVYLIDDVHFDPECYTNPHQWDPSRYLPERAEDKKQPVAYLGWGTGRHPCLGMRFAKLEMSIIIATFVSMFDYQYIDAKGNVSMKPPAVDRNKHSASKPKEDIRLKYKLRESVA